MRRRSSRAAPSTMTASLAHHEADPSVPSSAGRSFRVPRSYRVAALIILSAFSIVTAVFLRDLLLPQPPTHHTVSTTHRLVPRGGESTDPVWVSVTLHRDIWIHPDGSGRIQEQYEPIEFPDEAEHAQAEDLAEPLAPFVGLNESFAARELIYVTAGDLMSRIDKLRQDAVDAGQLIDFFGSYLTETVPTADAVNAAIEVAAATDGVEVQRSGSTTTVSAVLGTRRIIFTFDSASSRLVREQRIEMSPLPGLDLAPPIVVFEQTFVSSVDERT